MRHTAYKEEKRLIGVLAGIVCGGTILLSSFNPFLGTGQNMTGKSYALFDSKLYLSNIEYVKELSSGTFIKDKIDDNTQLSLIVDGKLETFEHGLYTLAPSEIVYNFSEHDYDRFTSYIGLESNMDNSENIILQIYTSQDGKNWLLTKETELSTDNIATKIDIDIKNCKYLKLSTIDKNTSTQDYIIFADAAIVKDEIEIIDCTIDPNKCIFEENKTDFANFSFDGENANKLVLSKKFENTKIRWSYSIDGGINWIETLEHTITLSNEELQKINSKNDIKFRIVGLEPTEENTYTIDIKESQMVLPLYNNDWENSLIGATENLEWKLDINEEWTDFKTSKPNLTGNKNLIVRLKGTKNNLPSEPITFTFTNDDTNETKKYIPISNYKIESVTSEDINYPAKNVIDGNIYTSWKSVNKENQKESLTIELNSDRFLSKIDLINPISTKNAIKKVTIQTSLDNIVYKDVETKTFEENEIYTEINFKSPVKAKYVRTIFDEYQVNAEENATLAMINIYEDATISLVPTAQITYSTTTPTNKSVVATLKNPNRPITITSQGGDSHEFKENGEFKFEFIDEYGVKGETIAKVDWIDLIAPVVTLQYDKTTLTKEPVTVTIAGVNEEIFITNNDGLNTHTFTENGTFEFYYQDRAGNTGMAIALVDWIETDPCKIPSASKPTLNSTNKSSNTTSSNTKEPSNKPNHAENENTFSIDNITIEIPKLNTREKLTLAKDKIELTKNLVAKVGSESEYFELYLKDEKSNKKEVKANLKITINLETNKKFLGIYKVSEDETIEKIDYSTVGSNKIQFELDSLGEFIISYDKEDNESKTIKENKSLIGTIVILAIMFIIGIIVHFKNKEN